MHFKEPYQIFKNDEWKKIPNSKDENEVDRGLDHVYIRHLFTMLGCFFQGRRTFPKAGGAGGAKHP